MSARVPTRDERDVQIARKMFIGGLFFLPWLWVMCLMKLGVKRLFDRDNSALRWCEYAGDPTHSRTQLRQNSELNCTLMSGAFHSPQICVRKR